MADRKDFFSGQLVGQADVDDAFAQTEAATWQLSVDQGLIGILTETFTVVENAPPDYTVVAAPFVAYDKTGRRIHSAVPITGNFEADEDGFSTIADILPGNERWLSLYARFVRLGSDVRGPDLSNNFVDFQLDEYLELYTLPGAQAAIGLAVKPPIDDTDILLCETLFTFGQADIQTVDLDFSRTEMTFNVAGTAVSLYGGTVPSAIDTLTTAVNNLADGTIDVEYSGAQKLWGDGTTNVFTAIPQSVAQSIEDIPVALAKKTSDVESGSAYVGSYQFQLDPTAPIVATGTVRSQLKLLGSATYIYKPPEGNFSGKFSVGAWLSALASTTSSVDNGAAYISMFAAAPFTATNVYANIVRLTRTNAGSDGASHIGTEAKGSLAGATARAQFDELDVGWGKLARTNTWTAVQTFSAEVTLPRLSPDRQNVGVIAANTQITNNVGIVEVQSPSVDTTNYNLAMPEPAGGFPVLLLKFRGGAGSARRVWVTNTASIGSSPPADYYAYWEASTNLSAGCILFWDGTRWRMTVHWGMTNPGGGGALAD